MGKDASTIRQEIEQTRERMGDTVEALAYKTDVPARVKDNVNERVGLVKETIGGVVDSVKTAVAGASDNVQTAVADATDSVSGTIDESGRIGAHALSRTRERVGAAVDRVNSDLSDRLQNIDVSANARRAVGMVQENPLGLALAALAIGFLSGSLLPVTVAERKRFGPIGDKVVDQAQAAAADLVTAGKAVVAETAQNVVATALSSAQTHGHDVVDNAKARAESR